MEETRPADRSEEMERLRQRSLAKIDDAMRRKDEQVQVMRLKLRYHLEKVRSRMR